LFFGKTRFSKVAMHYMKQKAKSEKPFSLNSHVLERAQAWKSLVSVDQI